MSDTKSKYICEQCNFKTDIKTRWEAHEKTEKHKTGKRKVRSDYKGGIKKLIHHKCNDCDYETTNTYTLKQHILNQHSTKEEREEGFTYYCKLCDCGTFSKSLYTDHLNTQRHKIHAKNYI
jgi:hypothetical protein